MHEAANCRGGQEAHEAHYDLNGECPWDDPTPPAKPEKPIGYLVVYEPRTDHPGGPHKCTHWVFKRDLDVSPAGAGRTVVATLKMLHAVGASVGGIATHPAVARLLDGQIIPDPWKEQTADWTYAVTIEPDESGRGVPQVDISLWEKFADPSQEPDFPEPLFTLKCDLDRLPSADAVAGLGGWTGK